jgi:hypothetical protein
MYLTVTSTGNGVVISESFAEGTKNMTELGFSVRLVTALSGSCDLACSPKLMCQIHDKFCFGSAIKVMKSSDGSYSGDHEIVLPHGVSSIGACFMAEATNVRSVDFSPCGQDLREIEAQCLARCDALLRVTMPRHTRLRVGPGLCEPSTSAALTQKGVSLNGSSEETILSCVEALVSRGQEAELTFARLERTC